MREANEDAREGDGQRAEQRAQADVAFASQQRVHSRQATRRPVRRSGVRWLGRCADGVKAAVDVEDLAADRAGGVGEQEAIVSATGPGSEMSQPSGAWACHSAASCSKPGMPWAATVPSGPAETRLTRIPRGPRSRAR